MTHKTVQVFEKLSCFSMNPFKFVLCVKASVSLRTLSACDLSSWSPMIFFISVLIIPFAWSSMSAARSFISRVPHDLISSSTVSIASFRVTPVARTSCIRTLRTFVSGSRASTLLSRPEISSSSRERSRRIQSLPALDFYSLLAPPTRSSHSVLFLRHET